MPDYPSIFVFAFDGTAETALVAATPPPAGGTPAGGTTGGGTTGGGNEESLRGKASPGEASPSEETYGAEVQAVSNLNANADDVARNIERETRRLVRSLGAVQAPLVQAEVEFHEGTIVVEGSVLIVGLLGLFTYDVAKDVVAGEIAQLLRTQIRRTLLPKLRETLRDNRLQLAERFNVDVRSQHVGVLQHGGPPRPEAVRPDEGGGLPRPEAVRPEEGGGPPRPEAVRPEEGDTLRRLMVTNTVALIAILIVLIIQTILVILQLSSLNS